jgi:hypothetical protein
MVQPFPENIINQSLVIVKRFMCSFIKIEHIPFYPKQNFLDIFRNTVKMHRFCDIPRR